MRAIQSDAQAAWKPLGRALAAYLKGARGAQAIAHRSDGQSYAIPARLFFRSPRAFSPLEKLALSLVQGRVLDVGAGAGCHALALQRRGIAVCALDALPQAVRVMRQRGVRDPRQGDFFLPDARAASRLRRQRDGRPVQGRTQPRGWRKGPERFDTLLMMMNGIAPAGTLAGLRRFLRRARRVLRPGGRVLLDSLDLRLDEHFRWAVPLRPHRRPVRGRRYFGEVLFRLEQGGRVGPPFRQLFVDPGTLRREAARCGWRCQVIYQEQQGRYLARLEPLARAGSTLSRAVLSRSALSGTAPSRAEGAPRRAPGAPRRASTRTSMARRSGSSAPRASSSATRANR